MCSSLVPAVPWTTCAEVPLTAAERCSESQLFAVPGSPTSISARSDASVAMATCTSDRSPMYFGVMVIPATGLSVPITYASTARGERRHPGGRGEASFATRASSSAWYLASAGRRISGMEVPYFTLVRGSIERSRDAPRTRPRAVTSGVA